MTVWKLEVSEHYKGSVHNYGVWCKSEEVMNSYKESYIKNHPEYEMVYNEYEYDFNDVKDKLTIADYEMLFNEVITPNELLTIEDFKEGMWVWNDTDSSYILLRYIYIKGDYHWADGWGNNIENDKIYRYKPNVKFDDIEKE